MSKAADLASLASASETALSNRNIVINGAMQISQRATSATISDGANEGYRTLDRWRVLFSSSAGGVATMSQDTTVPNTSFKNSIKIDVTTADTSVSANHAITLQQRFEAQDIANSGWDYTNSNAYMSVSFWARSTKAGTYCVFLFTQDGTPKNFVQEYTLVANTWKYVTFNVKGDSGISFNDDNGNGLIVGWTLVAGSNRYDGVTAGQWITTSSGSGQGRYATSNQVNFFDSTSNDWYITGVQMEVGPVATPFEHRSFGQELALCQRYFCKTQPQSVAALTWSWNGAPTIPPNTGDRNWGGQFPVAMRTTPTVVVLSTDSSTGHVYVAGAAVNAAAADAGEFGFRLTITEGGGVGIGEDAALNWNADAEL
tara:strand:- start:42 stop:1151 length:1110 start_codon:yes stop_codon:yes gene_type:complete